MSARRFWTEAEIATLRARYPHEKTELIAAELSRKIGMIYQKADKLGLKKTAEYLASPDACRLRRGDDVGAQYRFEKGQAAWNKGIPFNSGGRSAETHFKPGAKPANHKPVGTTREVDGYLEIKTAEGLRKWVLLHRHNWHLEHGSYPAKGMVLVFKDGNQKNCDIENLELISRAKLMSRNTRHNLPKELNDVIALRAALNRQINKRDKNEQHQ